MSNRWMAPVALAGITLLVACGPRDEAPAPALPEAPVAAPPAAMTAAETVREHDLARDFFSYANRDGWRLRHLELDLTADFERHVLRGHAILEMHPAPEGADDRITLDSRGLNIARVVLLLPEGAERELEFIIGPESGPHPVLGESVTILLPAATAGSTGEYGLRLRIDYETGPAASAVMWLPPELTAGGQHPFLFTQSQSIHARSWVPLQDTPAVRFTYEATIRTPPGLRAVMSADNDPAAPADGEFRFSMPQPIPSYLLALAVGRLDFAAFGERTGVYAEPELLPRAAWEFAETETMLEAAEQRYGKYEWGRYDLLILPPSFPYGGMENPRLSFITPSVLAGDRSLVSLIAHELAHSWSGNLVSNATWRDIWLNEGTTSYLEGRLMEALYGKPRADEERVLGYQSLLEQLEEVSADLQGLAPVFESGDPDVGQDGLQYTKGQLFLDTLEAVYGREVFDAFLAGYFRHFAWQAITSEQFLDYLDEHLLEANPGAWSRAEAEAWLYLPGIPASAVIPRSANLEAAVQAARNWASGEQPLGQVPFGEWSPQARVQFITALPEDLGGEALAELDAGVGLSASTNAEVARAWFIEVAKRRFEPAYTALRRYLGQTGRSRLIVPVYEGLAKNGQDGAFAHEIFEEYRARYHPLTVAAVEQALAGAE